MTWHKRTTQLRTQPFTTKTKTKRNAFCKKKSRMETTQHNATHVQHSLVRERTYVIWVKKKERESFFFFAQVPFQVGASHSLIKQPISPLPLHVLACCTPLAVRGEDHRPPVCDCRPFLFPLCCYSELKKRRRSIAKRRWHVTYTRSGNERPFRRFSA